MSLKTVLIILFPLFSTLGCNSATDEVRSLLAGEEDSGAYQEWASCRTTTVQAEDQTPSCRSLKVVGAQAAGFVDSFKEACEVQNDNDAFETEFFASGLCPDLKQSGGCLTITKQGPIELHDLVVDHFETTADSKESCEDLGQAGLDGQTVEWIEL